MSKHFNWDYVGPHKDARSRVHDQRQRERNRTPEEALLERRRKKHESIKRRQEQRHAELTTNGGYLLNNRHD